MILWTRILTLLLISIPPCNKHSDINNSSHTNCLLLRLLLLLFLLLLPFLILRFDLSQLPSLRVCCALCRFLLLCDLFCFVAVSDYWIVISFFPSFLCLFVYLCFFSAAAYRNLDLNAAVLGPQPLDELDKQEAARLFVPAALRSKNRVKPTTATSSSSKSRHSKFGLLDGMKPNIAPDVGDVTVPSSSSSLSSSFPSSTSVSVRSLKTFSSPISFFRFSWFFSLVSFSDRCFCSSCCSGQSSFSLGSV